MKEHKLLRVFWEILLGAFLLMPLIVTLIYSFVKRWTGVLPEGLTLQYYLAAVTNQSFLLGIFRGLVISALPVLLTNISILLALYVALVYLPSMEKWIQIFCLLPTTINGIIVATSVLSLYAGSGTILANRIVMLTLIMPVTYQGIRNSLYAVNMKGILEAAQMLGCGKFYSFMVIVVPSILPGVCGSALMSLAGLFGDFAIIKIIASSQFETAQAYLYRNRSTDAQSLSASVVILLLITLLINYSVHRSQNRKKERREA